MRLFKFFIFVFILIAMIFIGNKFVVKENKDSPYREEASIDNIMPYDALSIVQYNMSEVKSIATLSLTSSWEYLSSFFGVPEDNIRGSLLKKNISVLNFQADIIVFLDDNSVRQITLTLDGDDYDINSFKNSILENAKVHNTPSSSEIIEGSDGSVLVEIVSYKSDRYIFVVSNAKETDKSILTLDLINNYSL